MITVGFDAEIFSLQKIGGVSKYFASLIEEFLIDPKHGISPKLTFQRTDNIHLKVLAEDGLLDVKRRWIPYLRPTSPLRTLLTIGPIHQFLLSTSTAPRYPLEKNDVFHATYYRPTLIEKRSSRIKAVTIHDFIPEKLHWTGVKNPHIGKRKLAREADIIFCVSEATAIDLKHFYGIADQRVKIIGHGTKNFSTVEKKIANISHLPKLLFVGHRGGYKNFHILARAISILANRDIEFELITVGPEWTAKEIEESGLSVSATAWRHESEVTETRLLELYSEATILCMTSKMEGFGLPIIEALGMGTKVIAADIPVFHEVGGSFASYFHADSVEELADVLMKSLYAESTPQEVASRIEFAKSKSWKIAASKIAESYKDVLCRP